MGATLRRYFVAGLLVWIPLGITLWVLHFLVSTLDQTLGLLPEAWQPDRLLGFHIPGLGVVLSFLILLFTGVIAVNFFGAQLIAAWESLLGRIPFVKSIYSSVKQVSDTLLSDKGNAFRKALLVEFPREGSWTIGFLTGTPDSTVAPLLPGDHVSVYVPTTPNPTGGYLEIVPVEKLVATDWSMDQAMAFILSGGAVGPDKLPDAAHPDHIADPPASIET